MPLARSVIKVPLARALLRVAPLLSLLASCAGNDSAPGTPSGGNSGTGGSTASGGSATGGTPVVSQGGSTGGSVAGGGAQSTGGAGATPATGGATSGGTTSGGAATGGSITSGGVATGGGGGAATGGGATSGGAATTGGATSGGATSGGASTGGSSTSGGTTSGGAATGGGSSAGASGASTQPGAELNGASWTMKCTKLLTGNLCALLPPGQTTCPSGGYTSLDQSLHFGGTPGTTYQVTIHFEGTHEAGDYTGGTAMPKEFLKGATHTTNALHTWLSMEVSAPAATYNPNAGANGGSVQVYDYRATILIQGGATVRMKAFDIDCEMHRYCQNNVTSPCKGYVLDGISPAASPIEGSFLRMTVESVTAM
jgi:hypothetical protein